jgi:hypothetical protein
VPQIDITLTDKDRIIETEWFKMVHLEIGDDLTICIEEKHYEQVRRKIAEAMGLIVPEDCQEPEHVVATLGNAKTAVGAAV